MDNTVVIHYHSKHGKYFDLSLWQWRDGQLGKDAYFSRYDSFGAVATLTYPEPYFLSHVFVIVKNHNWSHKTVDFRINRNSGIPKTEVWIVDGDDTLYYSRQAAVSSHAYGHRQPHAFEMAINSKSFDRKWGFDGWLGFRYTEDFTEFRLWAPTAEKVELVLYDSTGERASVSRVFPMARGNEKNENDHSQNTHGVWFETIQGNLNYQAYRYRIYYRKRTFRDTRDPYSIATTANGKRSIVIAPEHLKPVGFEVKHGRDASWRLDNPNQAVIYEMHVRDFSKSATSGVSEANRGRFKGVFEEGTTNQFGDKTGFDYVKELGITHIQLQPVFDHHQIIEANGEYKYNWGYDPENFNVPEASFTSNPDEPATRILELKSLIQAYHDAGIAVIMDVVYNHTFSSQNSAFQLTVPDYYYRMNADGSFQDGSGCGNETASEKEMYRKYMLDSILYWTKEYNIDGFRFDLMGLHDIDTMNLIRAELDKIDKNILMYGEGWDMGTGLSPDQKAKKENAYQMPRIGFFNDDQRNAIKGAEVYGSFEKGFVSGAATEDIVAKSILGSDEIVGYLKPCQVLNYVEAHDNYNLNDLLLELHPKDDKETHIKRVELATAMSLLMQGMSFMQIGQEFLRSKLYPTGDSGELTYADKERAMNSYNAPDNVNQVNWRNVTYYRSTIDFVKKIIALKTKTDYFSYPSFEEVREHVFVETAINGTGYVSFIVDDERKYKVFFNASGKRLQNLFSNDIIVTNGSQVENKDSTESYIDNLTVTVFDISK
ncbi:type I pullulanase [Streptococcus caballi]|uniref:type I pullulanase n=1 Tax=Streptococcus caballi TaxID=439220 RepID=UPI0003793E7E|nr:type I pullulanase [Streptococcus caballi]